MSADDPKTVLMARRMDDLIKLYGCNTAERILLMLMLDHLKQLGFPRFLLCKLLKTASAVVEMVEEIDPEPRDEVDR